MFLEIVADAEIAELYYTLLLKDLGCSSNAARICQLYLTDDLSFKQDFKFIDGSLPQAMRAILPALANQSISVIKGTAVASVIFVNELTFRAHQIVGQNFKFFTVFAAAGIIYLVMTSVVAALQRYLERRFNPELAKAPVTVPAVPVATASA